MNLSIMSSKKVLITTAVVGSVIALGVGAKMYLRDNSDEGIAARAKAKEVKQKAKAEAKAVKEKAKEAANDIKAKAVA